MGVAVIDSGVQNVPDLSGQISKRAHWVNNSDDDDYGHGTQVAGIIAGTGKNSGWGSGFSNQYVGIAPDSNIISLRVLDGNSQGVTSNVIGALDWCIQNKAKYNIRVVNLSLGHPVYESYKTDPLCQAVERCVKNGIVVVVAAGNYGKAANSDKVYGGITSPGNDPVVITVGAVDTKGTVDRDDDTVASYSSRGPTPIDGMIKPDIVAPGNKIVAAPKC